MKDLIRSFMLISLLLLFIIIPQSVLSQGNDLTREEVSSIFNNDRNIVTKSSTETAGSPYLNDKFVQGYMVQNGGAKTQTIYLRYNTQKNEVEFLRNKKIFLTNAKKIKGFNINTLGKDIIFRNGFKTSIEEITPATFLRVIYNGDVQFLALHKAVLHKDLATYGTATKKNKYEVYQKYYLVTQDGTFHEIKSVEEDILKNLPDDNEQTKEYAYSNKLSFNKESDLVKILKHYDEISN